MRTTAYVLKSGRVTIDESVRDVLGLEHGDIVEVEVTPLEEEGST